uniref:Uncharacterized protein n=1 Tax=Panagrolaimus sp. ES5 TaxID=591445 RepID=A0AC34F5F8_9BILA
MDYLNDNDKKVYENACHTLGLDSQLFHSIEAVNRAYKKHCRKYLNNAAAPELRDIIIAKNDISSLHDQMNQEDDLEQRVKDEKETEERKEIQEKLQDVRTILGSQNVEIITEDLERNCFVEAAKNETARLAKIENDHAKRLAAEKYAKGQKQADENITTPEAVQPVQIKFKAIEYVPVEVKEVKDVRDESAEVKDVPVDTEDMEMDESEDDDSKDKLSKILKKKRKEYEEILKKANELKAEILGVEKELDIKQKRPKISKKNGAMLVESLIANYRHNFCYSPKG